MELNQVAVSEAAGKLGMTPEVFTKFLAKDTPEAEVTPLLTSIKALEVFKPETLAERLTNERQMAAQEATRTATGNTYGALDKRILDETGIAKNEGEKTIDYMARAAKEKFGKPADESAEMTRLRADLAAKGDLLQQTTTKLSEMEVAHATERKQAQVNSALDGPINALPINTTPELLDSQREFLKFRLSQAYTADVVEGKVQFTDKATGQVVRDPKTAAPITAAALIEQFAPKVVSLKASSVSQPHGYQAGRNDFTSATIDFSQFATKEAFAEALSKNGITAGSPEGGKLFADFMEARPDLFPK